MVITAESKTTNKLQKSAARREAVASPLRRIKQRPITWLHTLVSVTIMRNDKLKHFADQKLSGAAQTLQRAEAVLRELSSNEKALKDVLGETAFRKLMDALRASINKGQTDLAHASTKINQLIPTEKLN